MIPTIMKRIVYAVHASIFYIFTFVVALLPASISNRIGAYAWFLMSCLIPKRRTIAIDNISRALPFMKTHPLWNSTCDNPEELARETFKNIGRSLMEVCRLYHGRGEDLISSIELRGREHYELARAKGKGLIFFSGHCGNWELMALAFGKLFGEGLSVVARRQNNPYLNQMVEKMRIKYNGRVLYKQGAVKGILSALKKGQPVGILADQADFKESGTLIEVMGRKAWASKSPVIIAQKSGAPLIPSFIHREGERHVITLYPEHQFSGDTSEAGIQKETQALSQYIENYIVAHPTQWYWIHRRWKRTGGVIMNSEMA
jgi:KDO2-lipid IV(A) lauroyltransferase